MPRRDPEFKSRCQSAGLWESYLLYREQLKDDKGIPKLDAYRVAKMIFLDRIKQVEGGKVLTPDEIPKAADKPDAPGLKLAPASVFAGKTATPREVIEWVAGHLAIAEVEAKDAPSSAAWGMLCDIRRNPKMADNFWNTLYSKLLTKREVKDGEEEEEQQDSVDQAMERAKSRLKKGKV